MSAKVFPDPQIYDFPEWVLVGDYFYRARDVASFGIELTVENLKTAYRLGIFPWPIDGMPLPWYCPERRAVLEFSNLHVPKSLAKVRRRSEHRFTIDKDFRAVIEACADARRAGENSTWITDEFVNVYTELHEDGVAHSVEVRNAAGDLVGGLYGIDAGGVFCGESMFHTEPNTSKLALLHLIDYLKNRGATWLDIQVMTPHLKALGAAELGRPQFLRKLMETQYRQLKLF